MSFLPDRSRDVNFCARIFLHTGWVAARVCVCARVCARTRTATRFRRSFSPLSTRGGPRRPRRPAPVWQRRGRHRFRSATATARLPPGRHDTKSRAGRATVSPQWRASRCRRRDTTTPYRPLRLFRYRFRSFSKYRRSTGDHLRSGWERTGGWDAADRSLFENSILAVRVEFWEIFRPSLPESGLSRARRDSGSISERSLERTLVGRSRREVQDRTAKAKGQPWEGRKKSREALWACSTRRGLSRR